MIALVLNPGSNSLKFELIHVQDIQWSASQATKLVSAAIDDIGKDAKLSIFDGREVVHTQECGASAMPAATRIAVDWLRERKELKDHLNQLAFVGVRVVHGGNLYTGAVRVDSKVRRDIEAFEELAPLHNKSSLEILDVLSKSLPETPAFVTFDTAFHRTLPETAWRYPIERNIADRHGVRKFGFHGLSHRYLLERYAHLTGKPTNEISVVTLHLESGSSAAAIANGRSVDTTMGLTPLEGLMMGSRSGSIDPAILPYLMRRENLDSDEVLTILNKKSGLLGIAGGSLDTRDLEKRNDAPAKLALDMFSYRVRLAVGGYLAALGDAEAVLFGGGIGEDSPWLRAAVCGGLHGWGLDFDDNLNLQSTSGEVCLSKPGSRLQAWAMPVEEGLQIAHECALAIQNESVDEFQTNGSPGV